MGHSVQFYTFNIDKKESEINAIVNEDAIYQSDSRGPLPGNIRYLTNKTYDNYEAAKNAIENADNGWYDQLAVQFKSYEKREDTKAIINLKERIEKAEKDILNYKDKNAIRNRKSKFISCPKCGSKINKEYIENNKYRGSWNSCPLCHENLSSETIKTTIKNKSEKITEMRTKLKSDIKKNDAKGKPQVKWLVKTEFHI